MTRPEQTKTWTFRANGDTVAVVIVFMLALAFVTAPPSQAQTYTVLHTFGGVDGYYPQAGLTMDRAGNLYGTTFYGGPRGFGNVFKLTHRNSSWVFASLYTFQGGTDGANPQGRVAIGPDGSLYGTTNQGGDLQCACGTIFRLQPPATACVNVECAWTETVLYRFDGSNGAGFPGGDLALDQQGNIYGSAGEIYELSPSNGGWTISIIASGYASPGLVMDAAGNLYGTDYDGNNIFEFSPSPSGWVPHVLYTLNDGSDGYGLTSLVFDQAGNLYGGTSNAGPNGSGTVFQLSPSSGGWVFNLLYGFSGNGFGGPNLGSLLVDPAGNVYGAALYDGADDVGSLFQLTPSNGSWTYTDLHDFFSPSSGGCYPNNSMVRDGGANLYGTTGLCGSGNPGGGVVFEVTP